jgi:hypothetical protein
MRHSSLNVASAAYAVWTIDAPLVVAAPSTAIARPLCRFTIR